MSKEKKMLKAIKFEFLKTGEKIDPKSTCGCLWRQMVRFLLYFNRETKNFIIKLMEMNTNIIWKNRPSGIAWVYLTPKKFYIVKILK